MARLRSQRRRSRTTRLVVPLLVGGILAVAGYFLLPSSEPGTDEAAMASEPAGEQAGPGDSPEANASPVAPPTVSSLDEQPAEPPATADDEPAVASDDAGKATADSGKPEPAPAQATDATRAADPPAIPASAVLAQADALAENPLEARKVLNDALQSGRLDHQAADAVKARIRDLNLLIIFTPSRRFENDPQQSTYTVKPGDNLTKICRTLPVPPGFIARVNAVNPQRIRDGQSLKLITVPIHAVVSKKHFTMDLYLGALPGKPGSMYLTTYRVGLGEAGSTPTGLWEITPKSKAENPSWVNPRTNEVFERDDPDNPIGERWIGLTGIAGDALGAVSYGIHGTIEPESIGRNASMGCIRLKHEDVVEVFDMLSEGRSLVLVVNEDFAR